MTAPTTVLVVEDDRVVRDVVRRYLERDGHRVDVAIDGDDALRQLRRAVPDLVVLDIMLPGTDGLAVCHELRATSSVPIIMLTALGAEDDRIAGLSIGADDYLVKPFSPRELALRVSAVLRRSTGVTPSQGQVLRDGDLALDLGARTAHLGDVELHLTTRELDLLGFLMSHTGVAFSRRELLAEVWGWSHGDHSTVTVHIKRLRAKIEPDPGQPTTIATVRGVGYRYDGRAG